MRWDLLPVEDFAAHADAWAALNHRSGDSPLLRIPFVAPLVRHFAGAEDRLAVLRGSDDAPCAMTVLTRASGLAWQTLQPANGPLGLWVAAPEVDRTAAVEALTRSLPGLPLVLGITQQDPAFVPRPADTPAVSTLDYITTPRITVSGTFDEYWAARGKNLRHNINRQSRRLERKGIKVRLEVLTAPEDMRRAVVDYARLETSGWKGAAATAVEAEDAQGRFYTEMLEAFAAHGQAHVARLFYGDRLAASDINLLVDGDFIILKTAYDEAVADGTSPAQLMRHRVFRDLWDGGACRRIEFYGPCKEWHTKWTDEMRTLYHVNQYRWPVVAVLHGAGRRHGAAPA